MKKTDKIKFLLLFTIVILLLAISPGKYLPEVLKLSPALNHIIAFLTMGLLFKATTSLNTLSISIVLLMFGSAIEVIQLFSGFREFSFSDIGFDIVGILLFVIISKVSTRTPSRIILYNK